MEPLLNVQWISPDYFKTVGMRVLRGRGAAPTDGRDGAQVVWIDETVASNGTYRMPLGRASRL